ncbi:MAG: uroporphyrinogen-III C-methyltransferase [Nodosilinea sp.]
MTQLGTVYIVGAGPGRLDYLTVRGSQLLNQAQCLVHDALVEADLLTLLPATCEIFDMGKRGGQPSPPQAEIDQLLVNLSCQGKTVVRLKSGDPFIFGRTAAEIQALKAAGCPFEVVPGVSSALAAPLLAGIPLTDPVWSHGFGVVTAHHPDQLDWATLAALPTLVILMGSRQLDDIIHRLLHHGGRSDRPVAIIRWAGHPQQQVWEGTLLNIRQLTKGQPLAPSVIVIGEVVRLRHYLATHPPPPSLSPPPLPLHPKTILITRAAGQSSQFAELLTAQGATVVELPALEIRPPSSWAALDAAIASLPSFQWLLLTSANAVDFSLDRLLETGQDLRALAPLKIAAVGTKTAAALKQRGLHPDFVPTDFVAEALVSQFPEAVAGQRLLFPRVESGGRDVLVQAFTAAGATVVEVPAYESGCPLAPDPAALAALQARRVDVITFASSKTVVHTSQLLAQGAGSQWRRLLEGVAVASIGPKTSDTCREYLGRVDIEPTDYTLDALTQAIVTWASESSG